MARAVIQRVEIAISATWFRIRIFYVSVQYEPAEELPYTDIVCPMYPTLERLREFGASEGERPMSTSSRLLSDLLRALVSAFITYHETPLQHVSVNCLGERPMIMIECAHAMGNSVGILADYWKIIDSSPRLQVSPWCTFFVRLCLLTLPSWQHVPSSFSYCYHKCTFKACARSSCLFGITESDQELSGCVVVAVHSKLALPVLTVIPIIPCRAGLSGN